MPLLGMSALTDEPGAQSQRPAFSGPKKQIEQLKTRYLESCDMIIPFICSPHELLGEDDGSID